MGNNAFAQIANQLVNSQQYQRLFVPQIFEEDYQQWKKEFTFDAIKNSVRYGQSFCNTFNIQDNILYYERDPERADQYIRQCYVA